MQPVFQALVAAYPEHLQQEQFSLDAFLWAAQLWYAYAIQVGRRLAGWLAVGPARCPCTPSMPPQSGSTSAALQCSCLLRCQPPPSKARPGWPGWNSLSRAAMR
jgi:hypothetical protein